MSVPPTAYDLLGWFTPEFLPHQDREDVIAAGALLAARVHAVIAHCLPETRRDLRDEFRADWAFEILDILNGKKGTDGPTDAD